MNEQNSLHVLFEDNHLLVLSKPALLPTMGVGKDESSLLRDAKEYIRVKYEKPGNVYLGVVSRLDAFVSGVIVFARTSKAASRLSQQFRDGLVQKKYLAIVPDDLPKPDGVLEHYVYKNEARHRMFAKDSNAVPNSKFARLHYKTLGRAHNRCLLEIDLETGRKHQIRVQFSYIGCPIIGDRKYGSSQPFKKGIALHCRSLHFEHPTLKTPIQVETMPPTWWNLTLFSVS